ncbi:Oxyanion-translocating ATPase [Rubidibacter lacunae KORDI 51-2]|uniref:Oxyanion-translocating ATPase n=1 Tax=Rubidibacter lacunae KORDI 51-2 TaxID=582515 RepID=U5D732_9CHRO|nr:ArsA family ATPase [Rubidibacter lacunae]ERN40458.1 Oxyanion-translocating ATPase [Rubidibacter lacunae KORDI 51-2]
MAFILTFLGKGGTGRTTVGIAAAKRLAAEGSRVLWATCEPGPTASLLLGATLTNNPQTIAANLSAVRLHAPTLLEQSWEEVKKLEAQYLRSPVLKDVYGQELCVLPGMDRALVLNALREFGASDDYDTIVFDGSGNADTLRMLALPEMLSWYARRSRQLFAESDIGKTISPFLQPIGSAVLNVSWSAEDLVNQQAAPARDANQLLEEGKAALADPRRVAGFLVATQEPGAIASARYLWGSAQQAGLTVGGLLLNRAVDAGAIASQFAPLATTTLPESNDWQVLSDSLPNLREQALHAPRPVEIDVKQRQVRLFLPGFDKKQVKLTQYGLELTIEAGDLRRNLMLPPQLSGQSVKGAKFQDGYLIVTL